MNTTITKNFQQQLLFVISKIEKIEDLCKEKTLEPFGPYPDPDNIDYMKTFGDSKKLSFTDGIEEGISHMARTILRILYS